MPDAKPRSGARDAQRAKVYEAEQLLWRTLDRAWEYPVVDVAGSRLVLPPERKFGSIEAVQTYLDRLFGLPWMRESWPRTAERIQVRERAGHHKAHYERRGAVLAIPNHPWALRETVVLHELAHHLAEEVEPAHGPAFVARLLALIEAVIAPEAAFLLQVNLLDVGADI